MRPSLSDWLHLLALTAMWGSAFMFTKLAVAGMAPALVVSARLVLAAIVLLLVVAATRRRLPGRDPIWLYLAVIAVLGNVLPFNLITWGQQRIDSGLAGILMAIMPLFTLGLAHFFIAGERLSVARVVGFALGFCGIVVLMLPELGERPGTQGYHLPSMLAVLAGAICYGISAIVARLKAPRDAIVSATGVTVVAALLALPFTPMPAGAAVHELDGIRLGAVGFLGLFSTAAAAVVYFRLIRSAGPAFVSLLNYLIPLWAVAVGIALLGERPRITDLYALGIILAGIGVSQLDRRGRAPAAGRAAALPEREGNR